MPTRIHQGPSSLVASTLLAMSCSAPSGPVVASSATPAASTTAHTVTVAGIGAVELTVSERGSGHPILLLHGGAGPISFEKFAERLGRTTPARVITPTHPGFAGTPRPDALASIPELARVYVALLDQMDLHDVTVVGNSLGGWLAAEIALRHSPRVSKLVLVDATGIVVEGHPVADPFAMSLPELMTRSYYDPDAYRVDPSKLPEPARTAIAANRAALAVYGGNPSAGDATLRGRLAQIDVPTLVLWGEANRIGDPDYGRAYAAAIPRARFELLARTGHVPQIETPEAVERAIWTFVEAAAADRAP